ncbi:transposase [Streptantibioticus rubrisoli]|uniref:transposase n=1 Tax=Streptantibioticus rubrisoli TaxID=1387313 RepID=UPI00210DED2D|nr:transposase [Streptantibioticus rubrisoli]
MAPCAGEPTPRPEPSGRPRRQRRALSTRPRAVFMAESSERLGRRRWVIERTMSWLSGYRRLSPRYERDPRNYLAFLGLGAALCCY